MYKIQEMMIANDKELYVNMIMNDEERAERIRKRKEADKERILNARKKRAQLRMQKESDTIAKYVTMTMVCCFVITVAAILAMV